MSEANENKQQEKAAGGALELNGLYAFKVGMSAVFEEGERIPVTVLKYEPMVVSQIKTKEKDGYEAVQVAFCSGSRASKPSGAAKEKSQQSWF